MSDLAQYNIKKLVANVDRISPGTWVNHIEDRDSWGMVVACVEDQASVLWSRAPRTVPGNFAAPQPTVPKRARAKQLDDLEQVVRAYDAGYISKSSLLAQFELEETYDYESLTPDELQRLQAEGKVTLHHYSNEVTVERRVDQLPPYVRPEDVQRRRSRY